MAFEEWLKGFSALHERARAGQLSLDETREYLDARNELARVLLKQQHLTLSPGQKPRQALRVPISMPAALDLPAGPVRTLTLDVGWGGFSAIVPRLGAAIDRLHFTLTMPHAAPPLEGFVRVVANTHQTGSVRLSFSFDAVPPKELQRLELLVFDHVLSQLSPTAPARRR